MPAQGSPATRSEPMSAARASPISPEQRSASHEERSDALHVSNLSCTDSFVNRKEQNALKSQLRGYLRCVPDVILPVLDEAPAIPRVLAGIPSGYTPIVVDNASTDGSAEVARSCGATVVRECRRGFGAACWAGLAAATDEIVCFMDCDGSFSGADLPLVAEPVLAGDADLVLGARRASRGAWPIHARAANRFL